MASMKRSHPLLSIVIPTLNCREAIDRLLDSLIAQRFRDFEVILADGGSSDGTLSHAMARLQAAGRPAKAILSPGASIYASMNEALQMARGEWIYFIGSDDHLYAPDSLEKMAPHLKTSRADVVHGDAWIEDPGYFYGGEFPLHRLIYKNFSHQSAFYRLAAFRRHALHLNEAYPVLADWDCNLQLLSFRRFQYVPVPVASFGCEGLSSRVQDEKFMEEKEENALRYFGLRAYWLLPLDRLALVCTPDRSPSRFLLFQLARLIRSPLRQLHGTVRRSMPKS
jgi:glycosyltransferase involved in cell wall biosynthesis